MARALQVAATTSAMLRRARARDRPQGRAARPLAAASACPRLEHVVLIGDEPVPPALPAFDSVAALGGPAQRARLDALSAALDPDDAINIQFTSGTTGAPKGATLSHFNIVNNARYCAKAMALEPSATGCAFRCRCTTASAWCSACSPARPSGATMVFPGAELRRRARRCAPCTSTAAPRCTACRRCSSRMLEHPRLRAATTCRSLRTGIMAGAPCPIETMRG